MPALSCAEITTRSFVLRDDEGEGAADCEERGGEGEVGEEGVDLPLVLVGG